MDNSPFGRLSGELRNMIYEYTFCDIPPLVIGGTTDERLSTDYSTIGQAKPALSGLPGTCKAIRAETLQPSGVGAPFVIQVNRVSRPPMLEYDSELCRQHLQQWTKSVGKGICKSIQTVVLDIGVVRHEEMEKFCGPIINVRMLVDALKASGFRREVDLFIRFAVDPYLAKKYLCSPFPASDFAPFQVEFKLGDRERAMRGYEAHRPAYAREDSLNSACYIMGFAWNTFASLLQCFLHETPDGVY